MSVHPVTEELRAIFFGLRCSSVEWLENIWIFQFEGAATVGIEGPWRIVSANGVAITDADHLQKFGLPQPVDAATRAMKLLSTPVIDIAIDGVTADLRIEFEGKVRLEAWNNSSGYECWNCCVRDGPSLYAQGGGNVQIFKHKLAINQKTQG